MRTVFREHGLHAALFIFTLIMAALVITNCMHPLDSFQPEVDAYGEKAFFSLSLGNENGRTIMPGTGTASASSMVEWSYFDVTFSSNNSGALPTAASVSLSYNDLTSLSIPLDIGKQYSITVTAYNPWGNSEYFGLGTYDIPAVSLDMPAKIPIVLNPIKIGNGTGEFSWSLNLPENFQRYY